MDHEHLIEEARLRLKCQVALDARRRAFEPFTPRRRHGRGDIPRFANAFSEWDSACLELARHMRGPRHRAYE